MVTELEHILNDFNETNLIAYYKPYTFLPIDLLNKMLFKIIAYRQSDIKIINKVVSYLIFLENLYKDLDFNLIIKFKEETPDETIIKKELDFILINSLAE